MACSESKDSKQPENKEEWSRLVFPMTESEEVYIEETLSRDNTRWYLEQLVSDSTFSPPLQIKFRLSGDLVAWQGTYSDGKTKFTVENIQLDEIISVNTEALRGIMPLATINFDLFFTMMEHNLQNLGQLDFEITTDEEKVSASLFDDVLYEYANLFDIRSVDSFFAFNGSLMDVFDGVFYSKVNNSKNSLRLETLIQDNYQLWNSFGIKDYQFKYSINQTDCSVSTPFPPVVITVENSVVKSAYVIGYGDYENLDRWPTIEKIFNDMSDAEKSEYTQFTKSIQEKDVLPVFDDVYGFPISYYLNRTNNFCDSELMNISEFKLMETASEN